MLEKNQDLKKVKAVTLTKQDREMFQYMKSCGVNIPSADEGQDQDAKNQQKAGQDENPDLLIIDGYSRALFTPKLKM